MTTVLDHERPLETKPATPLWGEIFALAAHDPACGVSIFYSIGTWYEDTSIWREMLAVPMADGTVLIGRNNGRNTSGAVVSASLSQYEILESERRVRLSWKGPVWNHSVEDRRGARRPDHGGSSIRQRTRLGRVDQGRNRHPPELVPGLETADDEGMIYRAGMLAG